MRFCVLCFFIVSILASCTNSLGNFSTTDHIESVEVQSTEPQFDEIDRISELQTQIKLLKSRNNRGNYSSRIGVLIDMRIPSKHFRLFVVDLKNDSIVASALVSHGSGSETAHEDSLQFSNVPNSYMTSLGIYKIGAAYQGNFGRSFRLIGLDKSNDKAFARAVVLHRYSCVPDEEQLVPICNSLGCPMVSERFFPVLERFIDQEKLPVLMKIYY